MSSIPRAELLDPAEFAAAMGDLAQHARTRRGGGASAAVGMIPDDPNALAAEGGGDDPDACAHDVDTEPEPDAGARSGGQPRTAGTWRATWLAEVFRAEGLTVVEVQGWRGRGQAYSRPPVVSLFHHTASNRASGPAGGLRVVTYGRPGLPGPIANWLTARNGIIYVIAAGISHNAGRGNARTAGLPAVTGNAATLGNEMENDGIGEPYSAVQYTAAIKAHAAVHRKLRWPASRGIGHKEWSTTGKPDPRLDMGQVRRDLLTAINQYPTGGDDDMPMDQAAFTKMLTVALAHKDAQALLGQAAKEARFGFDASPDGKGWTIGGALQQLMLAHLDQQAPRSASHVSGDQVAAAPAASEQER